MISTIECEEIVRKTYLSRDWKDKLTLDISMFLDLTRSEEYLVFIMT